MRSRKKILIKIAAENKCKKKSIEYIKLEKIKNHCKKHEMFNFYHEKITEKNDSNQEKTKELAESLMRQVSGRLCQVSKR